MPILSDQNYVDKAENVIKSLKTNRFGKFELTMSQIRNLLSLTSTLYDESNTKNFEELYDKFAYLRVQFVYQSGRNESVKDLVNKAQILDILKEIQSISELQRFCRYMEALVAYFRFMGGSNQ